VEVDTGLVETC